MTNEVRAYIESKIKLNAVDSRTGRGLDKWHESIAHLKLGNILADIHMEDFGFGNSSYGEPKYCLTVWESKVKEYEHNKKSQSYDVLERLENKYGAEWCIDIERGKEKLTRFHIDAKDPEDIRVYDYRSWDLVKHENGVYYIETGEMFNEGYSAYSLNGSDCDSVNEIFEDRHCSEYTYAIYLPYPADSEEGINKAKEALLKYIAPVADKYIAIRKNLEKDVA